VKAIKANKCLIILDDLQNLFDPNQLAGNYQSDYKKYKLLFKLIAEINHQSCFILLSREKPIDNIFIVVLQGLGQESTEILQDHQLLDEETWENLINLYQGNPLWLELTASLIQDVFFGKVTEFLQPENPILGEALRQTLADEFQRLTEPEKIIIMELAKINSLVSLKEIQNKSFLPSSDSLNVIHSLIRRIILTTEKENGNIFLCLNPVLKSYVINNPMIEA
jgi:hypothetical protein